MIVLDTSAMVEFLVGADPIAERVRAVVAGGKLAAPHAIDLECAAALRGLVRGRKLPAAEAERALELLGSMRLKRYGHVSLLARIWQLRHNMWPYEAAYVALAEGLDAELVTLDGKIETIPGVMCSIRNLRGLRAISGHRAGELGAGCHASLSEHCAGGSRRWRGLPAHSAPLGLTFLSGSKIPAPWSDGAASLMVRSGSATGFIRYLMVWVAMPQSTEADSGPLAGTIHGVQLSSEPRSSQPG